MRTRLIQAVFAFALGIFSGSAALANPNGAQVANGRVTFSNPNPNTLNIRNSPGAIINWRQFSIGTGETTRFIQNSAASAILNRVSGQNPSALLGRLLSNGRVFLINRNGIVFGPNAVIDTAGLVASTLNITDQDFINQNLKFQGGSQSGSIENQGYIKAGANGNIFLIAPNIKNSGIIETDGGQLVLAAGESVSLVSLDSDNIVFDVQAPDNEVVNLGELITNGGAARMFAGTIKHSGSINADSVSVDKNGNVQLFAKVDIEIARDATITANSSRGGTVKIDSGAGTVWNSGTIEAKGSEGKGGHVEVLGERVALLDEAGIDVSGETGGGEALIGGDYQGRNDKVKNARQVYAGKNTLIKADAVTSGAGGKVIVWSDETTQFYGAISAKGGAESGDGGLIETSGHTLDVSGARVHANAPNGSPGQWLLDPINVTISNADAGGTLTGGIWTPTTSGSTIANTTIESALAGGTSVIITTTGALAEAGNITVSAPIAQTTATPATLTLQADNDIDVNATIGTSGARFNHDIYLNAGNRIGINSSIYLSDNLLTATAPTIALDAIVDVGTGTVQLDSTGNVTQSAPITAGLLKLLGAGGAHTLTDPGNQVAEVRMNTGSVVLTNNGTTTVNGVLAPGAGMETVLTASAPVVNDQLGASIDVDGNVMVVGAPGTFISGQGAAYVYRWDGTNWVFEAKLAVSGTQNFGRSVTVEGSRIVVGAPETSNGFSRAGTAYPFEWNGTNWVQGSQISFTEKVFESEFGSSVAIDNNRLVVGGLGRTSEGGFWTGKIWFYELVGGLWVEQGNARQGDPQPNDYFGTSLDISGDKLIVAAPNGPASGTPGKAYIFEYNPVSKLWAQTAKLVQSEGVTSDFFGQGVSISNDIAVVGADQADPGGKVDAGSLYVFRESGGSWTVEQVLKPTDLAPGDRFSTASRVRDGMIVSTSTRADLPGNADAGAGYLFEFNGTTWQQSSKITAAAPAVSDWLGSSAALAGQRIFLGALFADPGGQTSAGAAHIFDPEDKGSILASGLMITSTDDLLVASSVTSVAGNIDLSSLGNITVIDDLLALGSTITVQAGTDGSGDLVFDAEAAFNDPDSDSTINVFAGTTAGNTGNATLSGQNVKFLGADTDPGVSTIDIRLRGSGTLGITATGGDIIIKSGTGGTGGPAGLDIINIVSGDLTVATGTGGPMNLTAFNDFIVESPATGGQQLQAQILANNGDQTLNAGNDITLNAGPVANSNITIQALGNQTISANGGLRVLGGSGAGADALLQAQTGQSIGALFIDVIGAAGSAIIDTNGGLQDIDTTGRNTSNINEGILVDATGAAVAAIHSDGSQDVSVLDSDLVRIVGTVGDADMTAAGTQVLSVTGTGANAIEVGNAGALGTSILGGNQTITAGTGTESGSITIAGGAGAGAESRIDSMGDQIITTTGDLKLEGGFTNSNGSALMSAVGALTATVGGDLRLIGGDGIDNNDAKISADSIPMLDIGNLLFLVGGTSISSDVEITSLGNNSPGEFTIVTGGDLTLKGWTADFADARLTAKGPFDMTIGGNLALQSGDGEETDANLVTTNGTMVANVSGSVSLIGGAGLDADVELEADGNLTLTANDLSLSGGGPGASGEFAEIVSANGLLDITTTLNVRLDGGFSPNSQVGLFGDSVKLDIGGQLALSGGDQLNSEAVIETSSSGSTISATVGGNLSLEGGSGDNTQAQIKAQTSMNLAIDGDLNLLAGSGVNADADIKTNTGAATINVTGLVNVLGSADQADAEITSETDLSLTTGGDLNLRGGTGSNSDATVESKSDTVTANIGGALNMIAGSGSGADVEFEADTSFILDVGTTMTLDALGGGSNSFVFLGMTNGDIAASPTVPLTITTGGSVLLRGGAQAGTAIDLQGGVTNLDIGGDLRLTAGSASSTSVEIDQASVINIDVAGTLTLTGGSNTDTAALIGENKDGGSTVTIGKNAPVGGAITLTGGTHAQGLAVIGTTCGAGGCPATVTINGGGDVSLTTPFLGGEALIGSLNQSTGSVLVKIGLSGTGFPRLFGNGRILVDGPITLEALLGNAQINFNGEIDSGFGTLTATARKDLDLDEISGGRLLLKSTLGDVGITSNKTVLARAVGLAPATRAIDIQAPTGDVILEPDAPGDDMTTASGGIFISAAGELELDYGDDDLIYRTPGDLTLISTGGEVEAEASAELYGRNVTISAAFWVDTDRDITATGFVDIDALGGTINADNIIAALDINVNGNTNVKIIGATSTDGRIAITSSNGNVSFQTASGVLRSDKTGLANGTFAIDIRAPGAGRSIGSALNSITAASGGIRLQGDAGVNVNTNLAGQTTITAPGKVVVEAPNGAIDSSFTTGADISGASVNLSALTGIDTQGDITASSGSLSLNSTTGTVALNLLSGTSGQNVTINAPIITDSNGAAANVTGGGSLSVTTMNGFGSAGNPFVTQITSLSVAGVGDVAVDNSGMALAIGTIGTGAVPFDAVGITADQITGGTIFANSADLTALAGGIVLAVNSGTTSLVTTGAGASLSSNVAVMLSQSDIAGVARDFSLNASTLTLGNALTFANGGAILRSSNGLLVDQSITASTFLNLNAGGGILNIDGSDVIAGTDLTLKGKDVLLGGGTTYLVDAGNALTVNASRNFLFSGVDTTADDDADLNAGTLITIKAINAVIEGGDEFNTPARVTAPMVQFNLSGDLTVRGGANSSSDAKINAGNQVDVIANNVFIQGTDDLASAGIDPMVINMDLSGGLSLTAGTGQNADAFIIGDTVNINTQSDITLIGGSNTINAGFAVIESLTGDLTINTGLPSLANPIPGNVTLTPGTGFNADAVLIANSGSGQVDITAGSCTNCSVLGTDPILDPASQAGIFGIFSFTLLEPVVRPDTSRPSDTDQIIVLDDNLARLLRFEDQDEDEEDAGKESLMCR